MDVPSGAAMTAVITPSANRRSELDLRLVQARARLADARCEQLKKDTPGHRNAVAECVSRIDALLDMYLEAFSL
jgi:hypothetical protein